MQEETDNIRFNFKTNSPSIIKVIGVGGGGGNAVNHMYKEGIHDVSFVLCNTDNQALSDSPIPTRLQLGTEGLGAGNRPERAKEAALESLDSIKEMLNDGTRMVFITAGMGGGTGTGAAPVIAQCAKEMGILTVGIVTIPFRFEGKKKIYQALDGVEEISKHVDALLVINNELLRKVYPDLTVLNAFAKADDTLSIAAKSIAEIITVHGIVNLDFQDVTTVLKDGGVAIMSTGYGEGEGRVRQAIENALRSPLLNHNDIYKSKNGGQELQGTPLFLGVQPYLMSDPMIEQTDNRENLLGVFTSAEQYILEASSLHAHPDLNYDRIVYGRHLSGENMPVDDGSGPSFMIGQYKGFAIADGGTLWYAMDDELALMYPLRLDPGLDSDPYNYTAGDANLSYGGSNNLIMYDSRNNRFLSYDNTVDRGGMAYYERLDIVEGGGTEDDLYLNFNRNNTVYLTAIGDNGKGNLFDPDHLESGLVMDNMGMSTAGQYTSNVLAVGHVGSTFHAYELSMDAIIGNDNSYSRCSGKWTVPAEGDLSYYSEGKIPVTTSSYFTRMFFYAAGNAIYRVDLSQASPAVAKIWESENASDVVTGLKFKSDNQDLWYDDYLTTKGILHHLGAIVRRQDESCVFVEFNMTPAGEIEQNSEGGQSISVFGDGVDSDGDPIFSNVVDFIFSYRHKTYTLE